MIKSTKNSKLLQQLNHLNRLISRPLEFGICNNGQFVYSIFTWIEGEDAYEVIPTLSSLVQYQIGVKAGEILREIHEIPADNDQPPWSDFYNNKINKYISNYKACGIELLGADQIIAFIERNRYLLDNRPQSFQHGDFHIGNMIITNTGELGIIDFNRFDYGDPWEEFNRITFCAGQSEPFASGRINGYFNNQAPDEFFRLMALYIASNQLSAIHWAIPFGQEQVDFMIRRAEDVLRWYDHFHTYVPNWYVPHFQSEV